MSVGFSLIKAADFVPAAPRYRERPRINLASGALAGLTIHLSTGVPTATALDLACRLAALISVPVSVRAGAPLTALPGLVTDALARSGASPARLEVAVDGATIAQAAMDSLLALSAVRDQGVDVALYDFGDPCTLGLMQYLPLSAVILKPSLIVDVPGSVTPTTQLHTLLGVACAHGMRVIASGIETEAQRALLSGLGCLHGEGALFGTPAARNSPPLAAATLPKH